MRHRTFVLLADVLGKGLIAGIAGTAAMTLSSVVEMKLRGRSASRAPAEAICKVFGLEAVNQESQSRLNNLVHWAYGTGWGIVRSVIEASGIAGLPASLIHFALLWGTEQLTLPKVGVMPPMTQQRPKEIAIDAWHHFVYTQATATAYKRLFDGIACLPD